MNAARIFTLLQRVPGIVYVMLLACALTSAGLAGIYYRGVRNGAAKVERAARAEVTRKAIVTQRERQAVVDSLHRMAKATKPATLTTGATRQTLRARVELVDAQTVRIDGELQAAPPLLIALVHADDAKIGADSAHMVPLEQALPAAIAERIASAGVDSARVEQLVASEGAQGGGPSVGKLAVAGAAVVGVIVSAVKLVSFVRGR